MSETYGRKISRAEPGLIVLIIDDSGSMSDPLTGSSDPKYVWVERYVGHILQELLARSTEMSGADPVVKPRYFVKTIIYGSDVMEWPTSRPEILNIEDTVRIFAAGTENDRHTLGLGGKMGGTDADAAFRVAERSLVQALADPRFSRSFPPLVFHLSDGISATDASATAARIRALTTTDGNVLLLNALIDAQTMLSYNGPGDFPGYVVASEAGPGEDSLRMFEMSSLCPPTIHANRVGEGIFPQLREGSRLYFDVRTREMLKQVIQSVGSLGSRVNR